MSDSTTAVEEDDPLKRWYETAIDPSRLDQLAAAMHGQPGEIGQLYGWVSYDAEGVEELLRVKVPTTNPDQVALMPLVVSSKVDAMKLTPLALHLGTAAGRRVRLVSFGRGGQVVGIQCGSSDQ